MANSISIYTSMDWEAASTNAKDTPASSARTAASKLSLTLSRAIGKLGGSHENSRLWHSCDRNRPCLAVGRSWA